MNSEAADASAAETRLTPGALVPLLAVVLVTGWCWAPILGLPFTGEDFVILERLGEGRPAWLHVFRPLSGSWLGLLHAIFGAESPLPYHLGSLLLHLVNTSLVFLVAAELFRSRWTAALAAALFGISAGAMDSIAWISAVNRPWAGCGALLAYLGLVRLRRGTGLALALVVIGFLVAAFSNEEVYGLTPVLVLWLAWTAWKLPELRKPVIACAALVVIEITLQFLFLQQVPGGSEGLTARGFGGALSTITQRAEQMARGLGLDASVGLWVPLAGGLLLFLAGNRRAAALGLLAWGGSMIPFALSTASNYRGYPTLAPTAWLLAGGLVSLAGFVIRGPGKVRLSVPAFTVLVVAVVLGSRGVRAQRLERWRAALEELSICAPDARELYEMDEKPPVLVNLELSSAGPFYYHFGISDPQGLEMRGFLDAASAFEEPGDRPPGRWYGRRLDGTYGLIEPARYLTRPVVEPMVLYSVAIPVDSLAEARRLMAEPGLDLRHEALVETSAEEVAALGAAAEEPATIEILSPFEFGERSARMTVRIQTPDARLFAYQEHWLYEFLYRTSPDQAVITDMAEVRRVQLTARLRTTGAELETFYVNAFGLGCVVPPGEHALELEWSVRPAVKLR